METFVTWRAEIGDELAVAEEELAAAEIALADARAGVLGLRGQHDNVKRALDFGPHTRLANALQRRGEQIAAELRENEIKLRYAQNQAALIRTQIADLRRALEQLELILPAPGAEVAEMQEPVEA